MYLISKASLISIMPRIMYGVSPIGLGHATRTAAIVQELLAAEIEVRLFSGGVAADFLKACGFIVDDIVAYPTLDVVDGEMKRTALWYLRSWDALRKTKSRTEKLFRQFRPDAVVCDEEFSGVTLACRQDCESLFVADELELGFARGRVAHLIEGRVDRWYKSLLRSVNYLVVPDFGANRGNERHVGPIVRQVTKSREEVRTEYRIPLDSNLILFSMSGSGVGSFLLQRVIEATQGNKRKNVTIVVSGNRGNRISEEGILDLGTVMENQNLVAAADLVVSTAGKSIEDEAASVGTPFIGIPILHHAEQERNAASLGYSYSDRERIGELIKVKMGKREVPRKYRGAEEAATLISSVLD